MSSPASFVVGGRGAGQSTRGRASGPHGLRPAGHGLGFRTASSIDLHVALSQPHDAPCRVTSRARGRFVGGDALAATALDRMRSPVPSRLTA